MRFGRVLHHPLRTVTPHEPRQTKRRPHAATPVLDPAPLEQRLMVLRRQLMRAAVRYVRESPGGTRGDRLRAASALSGIPLNLIDVEEHK